MPEEIKKPEENATIKLTELVDRLEKANVESKALLARQEELTALNLIGGKTDSGAQPVQPKEESPREYAKRIMSGKV